MSSSNFYFRADRKTKLAAMASDWQIILDLFSEIAERNSTKVDRKQDLNILYQFRVFRAYWKPRKLFWPRLADIFSETAEQNATKLDRKQELNILQEVCF